MLQLTSFWSKYFLVAADLLNSFLSIEKDGKNLLEFMGYFIQFLLN